MIRWTPSLTVEKGHATFMRKKPIPDSPYFEPGSRAILPLVNNLSIISFSESPVSR